MTKSWAVFGLFFSLVLISKAYSASESNEIAVSTCGQRIEWVREVCLSLRSKDKQEFSYFTEILTRNGILNSGDGKPNEGIAQTSQDDWNRTYRFSILEAFEEIKSLQKALLPAAERFQQIDLVKQGKEGFSTHQRLELEVGGGFALVGGPWIGLSLGSSEGPGFTSGPCVGIQIASAEGLFAGAVCNLRFMDALRESCDKEVISIPSFYEYRRSNTDKSERELWPLSGDIWMGGLGIVGNFGVVQGRPRNASEEYNQLTTDHLIEGGLGVGLGEGSKHIPASFSTRILPSQLWSSKWWKWRSIRNMERTIARHLRHLRFEDVRTLQPIYNKKVEALHDQVFQRHQNRIAPAKLPVGHPLESIFSLYAEKYHRANKNPVSESLL